MTFIVKHLISKELKINIVIIVASFIQSLIFLPAFGQTYKNEAGATSDNDVYIAFLKDRYYTNGLLLHYRHALKQKTDSSNLKKRIIEFEIGQKVFSPYSAQAPNPAKHDRPFTAYLYMGSTLNWFYANESVLKLTAQIGTIGPNAFGKEVQESYHNLLGIYKVMGWDYQLKNEAALNFIAEYNKLLCRPNSRKADIIASSSVLVGNTFSGANAGLIFRLGRINSLYESISYNSLISNKASSKDKPKNELFLFTKPQINYVAYDATIEGGLFRKDKGPITFGSKPFLYSQQVGLCFSSGRWTANYIVTFKGKEVESSADPYRYASLVLLHRFK